MDKGKVSEPFEKTVAAIDENIIAEEKKVNVRKSIDTYITFLKEAAAKLKKLHVMEDSYHEIF